jgi:predicted nucleic acid-binding protein
MTRVVVDASAYAAIVFGEPEAAPVAQVLDGATVFAPPLLKFELASAALKKMRRSGDGGRVPAPRWQSDADLRPSTFSVRSPGGISGERPGPATARASAER